jgi:hypothetical protein
MGAAPSKPSEEESIILHQSAASSCAAAARILLDADIVLVTLGQELDTTPVITTDLPKICDAENFFGFWGSLFNASREFPVNEGLAILHRWSRLFQATTVAEKIASAVYFSEASSPDCAEWKSSLMLSTPFSGEESIDLFAERASSGSNDDHRGSGDDHDLLSNLNFDAHAPDLPGAFEVFTSCVDGHAARIFGHHRVRECAGSIQQWQCGSDEGPCRDNDVWEAPSGFSFNVVSAPAPVVDTVAGAPCLYSAPHGPPRTRPPVHLVPMYHGSCMDRALSVADAFRSNHPTCRSCGRAPARPAIALSHYRHGTATATSHANSSLDASGAKETDLAWADVDERRKRYGYWKQTVTNLVTAQPNLRVVVLEVGATDRSTSTSSTSGGGGGGGGVQRDRGGGDPQQSRPWAPWRMVRQESEAVTRELNRRSPGCATLVRINSVWPLLDRASDGTESPWVVSIMMDSVAALLNIDAALTKEQARRSEGTLETTVVN